MKRRLPKSVPGEDSSSSPSSVRVSNPSNPNINEKNLQNSAHIDAITEVKRLRETETSVLRDLEEGKKALNNTKWVCMSMVVFILCACVSRGCEGGGGSSFFLFFPFFICDLLHRNINSLGQSCLLMDCSFICAWYTRNLVKACNRKVEGLESKVETLTSSLKALYEYVY